MTSLFSLVEQAVKAKANFGSFLHVLCAALSLGDPESLYCGA